MIKLMNHLRFIKRQHDLRDPANLSSIMEEIAVAGHIKKALPVSHPPWISLTVTLGCRFFDQDRYALVYSGSQIGVGFGAEDRRCLRVVIDCGDFRRGKGKAPPRILKTINLSEEERELSVVYVCSEGKQGKTIGVVNPRKNELLILE